MKVTKNKVVYIEYTLKDAQGNMLDTSKGRSPLPFIQGLGNIIPGLEKAIEGKVKGDVFTAVIEPSEAYGEYQEEAVHIVPKSGFQSSGDEQLQEGMQVQVDTNNGPMIAMVTKVDGENVTLDLNHPLAGATLHFEVEVSDVRDASPEELDHGHVHEPGMHDH